MKPYQEQNYYELLEVTPSASPTEIRAAYERAVETYSDDSVAIYALENPAQAGELRDKLREAMEILTDQGLRETTLEGLALAAELRAAGIVTIVALAPDKLGKQFKEADAKGIPLALVVGPDELAAGAVIVKDLRSGEQRVVPRGEIVVAVRTLVGG